MRRDTRRALRDVALAGEAMIDLLIARRWVRSQSLEQILARLEAMPPHIGAADRACAADIEWALGAAARRLPLRLHCYERGIAAFRMLSRRGLSAKFHYGVGHAVGALAAHVWVTSGAQAIVGCAAAASFREVVAVGR